MKIIAFLVVFLTGFAALHAEDAPALSVDKATQIAQTTLDGLKLPPDQYFIRSVTLRHKPDEDPSDYYIATFEPPTRRKVQRVGSPPEPPPTVRLIKVTLDGKASVIDVELPSRRIVR